MIHCQRHHLEQRAAERGYSWESVAGCIAATHPDGSVDVDETHPAYPRPGLGDAVATGQLTMNYKLHLKGGNTRSTKMPPVPTGPGTELAGLLKRFGIYAKEKGCGCRSYQRKMDAWGPEGCRRNMEAILKHLAQEARRRGLPFLKIAAKKLVDTAISRAEKKT